jgi:dihydroorotase-like cyclic amidohydrolase
MKNHRIKHSIEGALFALLSTCTAFAQTPLPQVPDTVPQQIQQMQEANAKNEQQLHQYQWIETTTLTIHDEPRPPKRSICKYGPDGKVQKTPLGQQEASAGQQGGGFPGRGGLVRGLVMKQKKEEAQKELAQVHAVAEMYFPIDRAKLKQALQSGQVHFVTGDSNEETVVIDNYAKQGDEVKLTLDHSTMQMERVSVKSYLDKPKDALTAEVQFSALPDGTHYRSSTTINAPSKKLSVETVNSDYSIPAN